MNGKMNACKLWMDRLRRNDCCQTYCRTMIGEDIEMMHVDYYGYDDEDDDEASYNAAT